MNRENIGIVTLVDMRNNLRLTKTVPLRVNVRASEWGGEYTNSIQIWTHEGYFIDIQIDEETYDSLRPSKIKEES